MIPWLERDEPFPPVRQALQQPNGLLAASKEISVARLLDAYEHGIFPWYADGEPVLWWSPDPRMVLVPSEFNVSRSLRKRLRAVARDARAQDANVAIGTRSGANAATDATTGAATDAASDATTDATTAATTAVPIAAIAPAASCTGSAPEPGAPGWTVRSDQAFARVMRACAQPRADQGGTWITEEIIAAYVQLHRLGHAHSIEAWEGGELVGGLYGVCLGRMFYGESMFARATDASKICLAALVQIMLREEVAVIDCQQSTHHLASLGGREISRNEFCAHVARATSLAPIDWSAYRGVALNHLLGG